MEYYLVRNTADFLAVNQSFSAEDQIYLHRPVTQKYTYGFSHSQWKSIQNPPTGTREAQLIAAG